MILLPGPDYPAPAKLNLFLHVVGRRRDGYHLLQSVFTLIDRCDRLRFRVRDDGLIRRVNDVAGVAQLTDTNRVKRRAFSEQVTQVRATAENAFNIDAKISRAPAATLAS